MASNLVLIKLNRLRAQMYLQRTIRKKVQVKGVGLHTGKPAHLNFCPAPAGTGIYFVRKDLPGCPAITTKAQFVTATQLATTLGGDEFSVSTVEHCLSALAAFRIDNLFIELKGLKFQFVMEVLNFLWTLC